MSLLPQELRGAKERPGAHFPSHHVAPLVTEDGQVAIGVNPVLVCVPYHCLRCGTYDQFLFELGLRVYHDAFAVGGRLQAIVCHHGALLGKARYVLGLFRKEALGNQQGEISVLHTGCLEHLVKHRLHLFPYRVTIGLDDHTSANGRVFSEVCLGDQVVIPLTIIVGALG